MSARLDEVTRQGVTVGNVYRIAAHRWRVVRLSRTRAWCEPLQRGISARWLYLEVLNSPAATLDNGGNDGNAT
jgi:hypothetical protein